MLILVGHATTPDKLKLTTSAAVTVDVHTSHVDCSDASPPVVDAPSKTNTAITTATTTDIVTAPTNAAKRRNVKTLHIRNKHATTSVDVTVIYDAIDGSDYELHKTTLLAGEMLEYVEGIGFFTVAAAALPQLLNYNTSDQSVAAATTAYIVGTAITFPTLRPIKIGTRWRWIFSITKTAAGTAACTFDVRFGTAGTTGDTTRLAFATGTGTAAIDTARVVIDVMSRGPIGASAIMEGNMSLSHNLAATGFNVLPGLSVNVTSAAFDCTTANIISGVSVTTAASTVWNFELVSTEVTGA